VARALVVIPARIGSTRLSGKPLLAETGLPLIVHTLERAKNASRVRRVLVATDDEGIKQAVEAHGGTAVMTSPDHASGTDRVAEVARLAEEEIVVNLQGDEPEVDPALIDALVTEATARPEVDIVTAAIPFSPDQSADDPAQVKVVVDGEGNALYFSRARIPYPRGADAVSPRLHVGLYAFRRESLIRFARLEPSVLERTEQLEQLRALENRMVVHVIDWPRGHAGIDTYEDYREFVARFREGQ
jgi:3-deoxy-manno-octulosonate cytidylyltransferase (CMP-KDO synthetase)